MIENGKLHIELGNIGTGILVVIIFTLGVYAGHYLWP